MSLKKFCNKTKQPAISQTPRHATRSVLQIYFVEYPGNMLLLPTLLWLFVDMGCQIPYRNPPIVTRACGGDSGDSRD